MAERKLRVYIGTYTRRMAHVDGKAKGVYLAEFDLGTGTLSPPELVAETESPSFLAIHPQQTYLYAANEVGDYEGQASGAVTAFRIEPGSGQLTALNTRASQGVDPCYLIVDALGHHVLVSNYTSGSVIVFPIGSEGELKPASAFVQHLGSSVNPKRQEGPHAHSINLDIANRTAFVADLGLDKVVIYNFDGVAGTLTPNSEQPWTRVKSGAGPRHFDMHPSGKYAYLLNELGSTVVAFDYDVQKGTLHEIQTVSTLPDDYREQNWTADIHVHPSGRFVYASNRGHNSIAIFAVEERTGKLQPLGHAPTLGDMPRNFAIDPTGAYLLAANQNTDSIIIFQIDGKSGKLTQVGPLVEAPTPVCLKFVG